MTEEPLNKLELEHLDQEEKKKKKQWVLYELDFRCQCDIVAKGLAFY